MTDLIKRFKRVAAAFTAAALVAVPVYVNGAGTGLNVDDDLENAEFVLDSLGISQRGKAPDENVSRGLATAVITHILFERSAGTNAKFTDVPDDNMYAKEINQAADIGIVSGYGDGIFMPDRTAELNEIISILISALGYKSLAVELGGYPTGYNTLALRFDLLSGVSAKVGDEAIKYRDFAIIIRNFLDAKPIEAVSYGSNAEYKKSDRTILDDILSRKKLRMIEGVMDSFKSNGDEANKYVLSIDGVWYEGDSAAYGECLGYSVIAFAKDEGRNILTAVQKDSKKNETLEIPQSDLTDVSDAGVIYYKNNKRNEIKFSETPVVIKGGEVLNVQSEGDLEPINGKLILIDNNSDGEYDFIYVESKEYFEVERTGDQNNVIFLKDDKYSGSSLIYIAPYDASRNHKLVNANGEELNFSDIKSGDYISVSGSKDRNSMKITVLNKPTVSKVERIGGYDKAGVEVGGVFYEYAKRADGSYIVEDSDLKLNSDMELVTDGEILVAAKEKKTKDEFGFVIAARRGGSFESRVQYKILASDNKIYTGWLTDKVKFNGSRVDSENVNFKINVPVKYTIDQNGDIDSVEELEQYGEKETRKWNSDTSVFTSLRYNYPLFIDDNTKLYVVPDSGKDDDYRANLKLVDGEKYSTAAFDYDEDTYAVGAVVVYRDIAYDTPGVITKEAMPVILKEKKSILDEEDNVVYNLTFLEGKEEKSYNVKNVASINSAVDKINVGDVFRYSLNSIGLIDNTEVLLNADETQFFHRGANTATETVFGEAVGGVSKTLPKGSAGRFADIVKLTVDGGEKNFIIYSSKDIYYYLYDANKKTVRISSFDDIMTDSVQPDIKASKVYIYFSDNEAKCVTIIKGGGN